MGRNTQLFAWKDRGLANPKDAFDLAIMLQKYAEAGNYERLFGEELALLEGLQYDLTAAGAKLLGKDVAQIAMRKTTSELLEILSDPNTMDKLVRNVSSAMRGTEDTVTAAITTLEHFRGGLEGG